MGGPFAPMIPLCIRAYSESVNLLSYNFSFLAFQLIKDLCGYHKTRLQLLSIPYEYIRPNSLYLAGPHHILYYIPPSFPIDRSLGPFPVGFQPSRRTLIFHLRFLRSRHVHFNSSNVRKMWNPAMFTKRYSARLGISIDGLCHDIPTQPRPVANRYRDDTMTAVWGRKTRSPGMYGSYYNCCRRRPRANVTFFYSVFSHCIIYYSAIIASLFI